MKISYDEPKDKRVNAKRSFWKDFIPSFVGEAVCVLLTVGVYYWGLTAGLSNRKMIVLVAATTVVWALAAGFMSRWITQIGFAGRLKNISNAVRRVAAGDFSVRIFAPQTDNKKDEMEVLIEDFNKMAEELENNRMMKGDFISNVSHEMKTPLAIIKNYADALKDGNLSPQKRQFYVDTISESAGKLSNLIENVLRLNKMEHQAIVEKESFSLDEQLRLCVLALEEKFEEKDLELEIDLEEEIRISNDASLLEIAWNNILGNAVKYTEPGGTVSVSARLEKEQAEKVSNIGKGRDAVTRAVVCIRDTGCGMDPEAAQHMFDQFYQGDTSHASEGNGLGLAMVARVMELCKGEISVDTKEGEGTAIMVRLPLE